MTLLALFGCGDPTAFESGLLKECSEQRSVRNHRGSLFHDAVPPLIIGKEQKPVM